MAQVDQLQCLNLEECPDTVEWCPDPKQSDILACGTYQLLEQDSCSVPAHQMKRKGTLSLYQLSGINKELKNVFSLPTEAILDCKWHMTNYNHEKTLLGSVDGKGNVQVFEMVDFKDKKILQELTATQVTSAGLSLSLDWCPNIGGDSARICASDSNGFLTLLNVQSDNAKIESRWKCHSFEAWITAFNTWDKNIVYSGGDDCRFCGWDLREVNRPIFVNKSHDAGICSVQCNKNSEHILATGSYDEYIRLWDVRALKAKPLNEVFVGGGVWRLKWHHSHKNTLLAACMYNGFKVLNFDAQNSIELHSFNMSDGALAYGADWCRSSQSDKGAYIIGTATFYDKSMALWLTSLG